MDKKILKPASDPLNLVIIRPVSTRISPLLAKTFATPNQVSLFSMILGLAAALMFVLHSQFEYRVAAALLYYFYLVFDCVDGELARLKGIASPFGKWFDGLVDTVVTSFALAGLTIAALNVNTPFVLVLGFAAVIGFNITNFSYQYAQLVFQKENNAAPVVQSKLSIVRVFTGFSPGLQMLVICLGWIVNAPLVVLGIFAVWTNGLWIARTFKLHSKK